MSILAKRYKQCTASAFAIFKLIQVNHRRQELYFYFSNDIRVMFSRLQRLLPFPMPARSKFIGNY
jgi:hypothetical protein